MRKVLMLASALAMLSVAVAPASAQKIDKNGRCHDAAGRFAKAEVCGGVGGAVAKAAKSTEKAAGGAVKSAENAVDPKAPYKLDAKGKCHDVKGRMASKAKCAA